LPALHALPATNKSHQPPCLVMWGRHDKFFQVDEVLAYTRELDDVQIHVFDGASSLGNARGGVHDAYAGIHPSVSPTPRKLRFRDGDWITYAYENHPSGKKSLGAAKRIFIHLAEIADANIFMRLCYGSYIPLGR